MKIDLIKNKNIKLIKNEQPVFIPLHKQSLNSTPTPLSIMKARNLAIIACYIQLGSAFVGFGLYSLRRNNIFIAMNTICLLIAIIGLKGAISLNKTMITLHAVITTSFFGSFVIYQILEILFQHQKTIVNYNKL